MYEVAFYNYRYDIRGVSLVLYDMREQYHNGDIFQNCHNPDKSMHERFIVYYKRGVIFFTLLLLFEAPQSSHRKYMEHGGESSQAG